MVETKLIPGLLVAAPHLKDPNFINTVVLMLEHENDEGSLGLIINRTANVDLATVLSEMKLDVPQPLNISEHPPLLCGGPVSPERGWIVHTADWTGDDTKKITGEICVTSSLDILEAIAAAKGPKKYRFCLGYAGWGPEQLVDEIKAGAWINAPLSMDLVFDVAIQDCWRVVLQRLGIDPNQLVPIVGDA